MCAQDTKIFSPANMRAAQDLAGYDGLIKHWMESRLTLRYTGGLVRVLPVVSTFSSFDPGLNLSQ